MSKKGSRARGPRRVRQHRLRKLVREREKLAALETGGAPERPIEVPSPAVVELRAASVPCIQCEGELQVDEHTAQAEGDDVVRRVSARCRACGAPRVLWFRVVASGPN